MNKIGNYQILETVHRGPQPLYKATDAAGKTVALKVIPAAGLNEESRQRFIREERSGCSDVPVGISASTRRA